jgi:LPXTG-motif cell wall-anchored protein
LPYTGANVTGLAGMISLSLAAMLTGLALLTWRRRKDHRAS